MFQGDRIIGCSHEADLSDIPGICMVLVYSLFAEDIKLEHFSRDNGLSHNSVRHIAQDKTGCSGSAPLMV